MKSTHLVAACLFSLALAACGGDGSDSSNIGKMPLSDITPVKDPDYVFNKYHPVPEEIRKIAQANKAYKFEADGNFGPYTVTKGEEVPWAGLQTTLYPYMPLNSIDTQYFYNAPLLLIHLRNYTNSEEKDRLIHRSILEPIKAPWTTKDEMAKMLGAGQIAEFTGVSFGEPVPGDYQIGRFSYTIDFGKRQGEGYVMGIKSMGNAVVDKRKRVVKDAKVYDRSTEYLDNVGHIILEKAPLTSYNPNFAEKGKQTVYGVAQGDVTIHYDTGAVYYKDAKYDLAIVGPNAQEVVGGIMLPVRFTKGDKKEKMYAIVNPFHASRTDHWEDNLTEEEKEAERKAAAEEEARRKAEAEKPKEPEAK